MKKNYIAPNTKLTNVNLQPMLTASDPTNSGLVDHGENTPESRNRGLWDDDDDF